MCSSDLFGSDFFRTYQSTYMPINEPNLSAEYILDFGDTIEIQLVGQKNYQQKFALQRDGSINLPDICFLSSTSILSSES